MHGAVQQGSESLPKKEELTMQEQISSSMATGLTSNFSRRDAKNTSGEFGNHPIGTDQQ